MTKDIKSHNWWQTIPGILTAIAAVLTAITGLIVALNRSNESEPTSVAPQASIARDFQGADLSGRWSGFHGIYYIIEHQGDKITWKEYNSHNMVISWGTGKINGKQIKVEYDGLEGPGEGVLDISSDARQIAGSVTSRTGGKRATIALSR